MIKTGILGTSGTANFYALTTLGLDGFELTGCFSPDYDKTKNFAAQYNLVAYPTIEALFNYTDALVVTEFSPDFVLTAEKAIKNFKHILIANPFLAGLEEIQHLRKLSEESGVLMQIAGGFKHPALLTEFEDRNCWLADLRHSFGGSQKAWCGQKFSEYLLSDISLMLILLKGAGKKACISSWDNDDKGCGLVSVRLELDNGAVANLLENQAEGSDVLKLNVYGTFGESSFQFDSASKAESTILEMTRHELLHFQKSIGCSYTSTVHNDIMFQALELTHRIRSKTIQNFAVNFPN